LYLSSSHGTAVRNNKQTKKTIVFKQTNEQTNTQTNKPTPRFLSISNTRFQVRARVMGLEKGAMGCGVQALVKTPRPRLTCGWLSKARPSGPQHWEQLRQAMFIVVLEGVIQ